MTVTAQISPEEVFVEGAGSAAVQLLDVRAPIEVARCGIPSAVALPILDDAERQLVGICYREHGQDAAVRLGVELTAARREIRVAAWRDAADRAGRPVALTCWRGGQRSRIAQEWLGSDHVPRVQGGTKAIRRFLMQQLELQVHKTKSVVISGLTGTGKTDLLHAIADVAPAGVHALDLEGLAHHRGSAFGGFPDGQPAQQTLENRLAAEMHLAGPRMTMLEDEARNVGRLELPEYLWSTAKQSPVVLLEATSEERVARIAREYVFEPTHTLGRSHVRESLERNLSKLAKRLGGVRLRDCMGALSSADCADEWGTVEAHAPWILVLLEQYYDPFYQRAMDRMDRPIVFKGRADAVLEWFADEAKSYV
jgi:tRNA 2-selenouridine synthase